MTGESLNSLRLMTNYIVEKQLKNSDSPDAIQVSLKGNQLDSEPRKASTAGNLLRPYGYTITTNQALERSIAAHLRPHLRPPKREEQERRPSLYGPCLSPCPVILGASAKCEYIVSKSASAPEVVWNIVESFFLICPNKKKERKFRTRPLQPYIRCVAGGKLICRFSEVVS